MATLIRFLASGVLNYLRLESAFGLRAARFLAAIAALALIVSCARPQSVELSVNRAVLEDGITGKPTMGVYLNSDSAREFTIFTSELLGHSVEVRFRNVVLTRVVLRTPVDGGFFHVSVLPDHVDGTLNESNAAEIAQKLTSANAKIVVRVAD